MNTRDDDKSRIQQATDLVRLIGEQVALRARGKEFVGLCPFHDDAKPSMYVSPAKQIYKCFACGAGGDAFSFVMNYHKMSFPEALAHLAERAGIELTPRGRRADAGEASDRSRIADANARALAFFQARLADPDAGQIARDYLGRRGVSPEMVEAFALGYAPDGWDALATDAARQGWDVRGLELAGLVSPRRSGQGLYDRLRHRLVFPIFDAIGRPIAFGGRKLREEDEPKYLNSPETPLFNKSATLYGLHLAKKPMIDSRTAVIVEGYTDVIACHQGGETNVVATLGTALTSDHVRELRRYVDRVVLVFDADEAGHKAADRAVEVFLTGELDVSIAVLPEGVDPADLLAQADGPERWRAALDAAQPALAYQVARLRERFGQTDTVTGRERLLGEYLSDLTRLGIGRTTPVRRLAVTRQLADLLGLPTATVDRMLKQRGARSDAAGTPGRAMRSAGDLPGVPDGGINNAADAIAPAQIHPKLKAVRLAQRQLIGCLLRNNQLLSLPLTDGRGLDEALPPDDFVSRPDRLLYQRVYDALAGGESLSLAGLLGDLAAEGLGELGELATQADLELDRALAHRSEADQPEALREVAITAAEAIRSFHREQAYDQAREALAVGGGEGPTPEAEQLERISRLLEHRRAHPSPARIARLDQPG